MKAATGGTAAGLDGDHTRLGLKMTARIEPAQTAHGQSEATTVRYRRLMCELCTILRGCKLPCSFGAPTSQCSLSYLPFSAAASSRAMIKMHTLLSQVFQPGFYVTFGCEVLLQKGRQKWHTLWPSCLRCRNKDKWALLPVLRSCVSSNGCRCLYDGLIRGACNCTRVVGACDT